MAHSGISRRRTPILCIAYGDQGASWLEALKRRCRERSEVRELMDRGVVQFWGIGAAGEPPTDVEVWPDLPTLPEIAAALDRARSAQARAAFPDLEVRDVLVLERVSLFAPNVAERRAALRDLLESVPDVEGLATQGQQGFRYRWVTLADALHSPTHVTQAGREAARAAAQATSERALTFLVDRQDSDVAVIDEDLASRCLGELAMAFVHGDIGAPRNDGASVALPGVLREGSPGRVIPFGVAVLEHPWREIEAARVCALRQRLAAGIPDRDSIERFSDHPSALLDEAREDRAALDRGAYDRYARRRARDEAVRATLARMFADGDVRYVRSILTAVANEVRQFRIATLPLGQPAVAPAAVAISGVAGLAQDSANPLPVGAGDGSGVGLVPVVLGGVLIAAFLAALGLLFKRSRGDATSVPESHGLAGLEESTTKGMREEIQREWEALHSRLSSLVDAWEAECRAARAIEHDSDAAELWAPVPPVARRLTHQLPLAEADVVVSWPLCEDVARHCAELLDDRTDASEVLEEASRRALRRWDERRQAKHTAVAEFLRRSLEPVNTAALRRFIESRPYLANPASPPVREAIVWLTAPALGLEEQLKDLEQAAARTATIVLSHDDEERSVRLSFAQPVPWRSIPSLAFPTSDVE